ncbi:BCL2/adenovirus E1B 19 kDa protein-interacting protein 3-like, partial [Ruditapes philippinarum]|uniref:BCL2/adenovirus E1B 19 kDa protein-interacting protein 3-like n=1 Tax=Ruditapes philippinarum TaxID=129788 RepID=UPI00295B72B6
MNVLNKDELGGLNESWVDVYKNESSENSSNGAGSPKNENFQQSGLYTPLNIEKLLQDAQRESEQNSRETSTRTSPKIRTPTEGEVTQELSTDWIWDWSSGPEMVQPSQAMKFTKAAKKRPGYTLRNTSVMRTSIFCKENV